MNGNRSFLLIVTGICLAFLFSACAGIQPKVPPNLTVYTWTDISSDTEKAEEIYQGLNKGTPYIFKIEKGDALPFEVKIDLPFVFLTPSTNELRFVEDVYVYISNENIMFSPDGDHWASPENPKQLKSLFGIQQGFLSVGFTIEKKGDPMLRLELGTKPD